MANVLIVDDDTEIRITLRMLLEDAGHAVSDAANGADALALLRTRTDQWVMLVDLIMPGMSGIDLLEAIRADSALARRHAYVLMTADHRAILSQSANLLATLEVAIVRKPFDVDAMLTLIDQCWRRLVGHT